MPKASVAISMDIDLGLAKPEHIERYLTKEIKKAMARAQIRTPAAPKMLNLQISVIALPRVITPLPGPPRDANGRFTPS